MTQVLQATPDAVLTSAEALKLGRLEAVVSQHLSAFKQTGLALLAIRDERLYRQQHASFEDYCASRWSIHRSHAYRLIEAAQVATKLEMSPMGDTPAPTRERQVRPLKGLEQDVARQAWVRANELSGGESPKAAHVEQAVAEVAARAISDAVADARGRRSAREAMHSSESVDWYSPEEPVILARQLMGGIDIDPASSAEANLVVKARQFFTASDDGLSKSWMGNVFLNWPGGRDEDHESNADNWSRKLLEEWGSSHIKQAVCLIFNAATGASWFQRFWDFPICFVRGRYRFRKPGGEVGTRPSHSNAIVYLGPETARFVELFSPSGRIVLPRGDVSESLP
jgi:hypothetical protein